MYASHRIMRFFLALAGISTLCLLLYFYFNSANNIAVNDKELYWWRPREDFVNFGDELSPIIVDKMLQRRGLSSRNTKKKRLLALGSILHFAKNENVIWGTGRLGSIPLHFYKFDTLDVRAVRGPLTRDYLLSRNIPCPEVYGDPAILLSFLFPEWKPTFERDYIIIPNLREIDAYQGLDNLVLPIQSPDIVIKEILKSKLVISGSLHGIIVAESFGIRAQFLRLANATHMFKYTDYYTGTNRTQFRVANSVSEALQFGGEPVPKLNIQPLLNAFPYDIFE